MSSPKPILTNCTSILLLISPKVCLQVLVFTCVLFGMFAFVTLVPSPTTTTIAIGLMQSIARHQSLNMTLPCCMTRSVPETILTLVPFQSLRTLEHQHDRSLPALHVSSSKNSRPTCMMNCSEGRTIQQRTKVGKVYHPSGSGRLINHLQYLQSPSCPSVTISIPSAIRPDRN